MRLNAYTIALVVFLLLVAAYEVPKVVNDLQRGSRVGPDTRVNGDGFIVWNGGPRDGEIATPAELAAPTGYSLDVYSGARVLRSEHGRDGALVKACVAYVILKSAGGPWNLHARCVGRNGLYDAQKHRDGVEYVSTAQDPYQDDIAIMGQRIAEWPAPPVPELEGATNFYSPSAQDALYALGKVRFTADGLDAKWRREGLHPVGDIDGVSTRLIKFYRRA